MKAGQTLFVAATAAEAKAAGGSESPPPAELRAWLTGQALAGMGMWTPDLGHDPATGLWRAPCDLPLDEWQMARAQWAVRQADQVLKALGYAPASAPT